jgi:hypothetical protein
MARGQAIMLGSSYITGIAVDTNVTGFTRCGPTGAIGITSVTVVPTVTAITCVASLPETGHHTVDYIGSLRRADTQSSAKGDVFIAK